MAERTKFKSYFVYSLVITALIYPIVLRWTWGGGWLAQREFPFSDFAGSTIVHGTGGWAALMGAIILGPRIGKYGADRSEEHTSELQSLMRNSYALFCLKQKNTKK